MCLAINENRHMLCRVVVVVVVVLVSLLSYRRFNRIVCMISFLIFENKYEYF